MSLGAERQALHKVEKEKSQLQIAVEALVAIRDDKNWGEHPTETAKQALEKINAMGFTFPITKLQLQYMLPLDHPRKNKT
jgi:hypothetical protein